MERTAILLSTFNGERWLPKFLESLVDQSVKFILVWRDDGSHDASVEIVRQHKNLRLMEAPHSKPGRNIGPILSFSSLLEFALEKTEADYFFFADQDDEWCSTKLEEIIAYISDLNQKAPLIVHHDLEVVDQYGVCIADSLWGYMGLDKSATRIEDFITRNAITGCAMAVNRQLANLVIPFSVKSNMHDWWMALIASVVGEIHHIDRKLVRYRQHGDNTVGAKSWWSGLNPLTNWRAGWVRGNEEYRSLFLQAKALRDHLRESGLMTHKADSVIRDFLSLPCRPVFNRLIAANKMGLRRNGFIFWLIGMIRIATTKVDTEAG